MSTIVIAGAGLAGATAAETLREEGFDRRLVLIGDDPDAPYDRPPLSKAVLRGDAEPASAFLHDTAWYAEHDVELLTGARIAAVDRAAGEVELRGGDRIGFDRLLLATGATPRRPSVVGVDLPGVHLLRTLRDAQALRDALAGAARAVIIGAGWIGCEVAAAARARGVDVTLVEHGVVPLERVLGHRLGAFFAGLHRDHGVELLTGRTVEAVEGAGRAERVRLADGTAIDADVVVAGVGVRPNVDLAAEAGLEVFGGIAVDAHLRTSDRRIFAAGDAAAAEHPLYDARVRVEHWDNAKHQGAAAARSMLDRGEPYDRAPYFFSDQYDVSLEYSGWAPAWDDVTIDGDLDERKFSAAWLREGREVARMAVNVPLAAAATS